MNRSFCFTDGEYFEWGKREFIAERVMEGKWL